jgi:hypothetical protein
MAARYLLIVTAEVDAAVEEAWSRWYDEVHLPDALACPGVRSGRRFRSVGEIGHNERGTRHATTGRVYTTIYELDSPDAVRTPEFLAMRGWARFAPHVRSSTRVVEALG